MPRPRSKSELLELSKINYDKLMELINSFSPEQQQGEFPPGTMNRNIRDLLAHLHEWHLMFLQWHDTGMTGEKPDIPARGYTWKTVPDLNRVIWEKYRDTPLAVIRKRFAESHRKVRNLIDQYSDEELFEKKRYKWTGSTSLGAYMISATSSHYDWASKLIRKYKKHVTV